MYRDESESESEVAQSCPTLCDSVDCSPPCSSVHGILQARTLEGVAIPFSQGIFSSQGLNPSPALQVDSLPSEPLESESELAQLCPTLCDPMDCSLLGSSVHGIFQARVLEWVAISFSRGFSQPKDRTQVSRIVSKTLYRLSHQGSPIQGKCNFVLHSY